MAPWMLMLLLLWRPVNGAPPQQLQDGGAERVKNAFCQPDWHPYGEKCYRILGMEEYERLNWEDAGKKCAQRGGQLATVHSRGLQEYVTTFLLLEVAASVWIGLHDRHNESTYEWQDGATLNFTNWGEGEPTGLKNEVEDCVEMIFFSSTLGVGTWNDIDCDWKLPYLCQVDQKAANPASDDPRFCADGGYRLHGSCFHVYQDDHLVWAEAEARCISQHHGHLAAVTDWTMNEFLIRIFSLYPNMIFWIGLSIGDPPLRWQSGRLVGPLLPGAHRLSEANPPRGSCVAEGQGGWWEADSCLRALPFICQISTTAETSPILKAPVHDGLRCPQKSSSWFDLGGKYCYYVQLGNPVSWFEASHRCLERGASLASFHSEEEAAVMALLFKYTTYNFHIGLYLPLDTDEGFLWTDGSAVDFTFWERHEPSNREQRCTEMQAASGRWNDLDCDARRGYLCSAPKIAPNGTVSEHDLFKNDSCKHTLVATGLSAWEAVGLLLCAALVATLFGAAVYHFRRQEVETDPKGGRAAQRYRSGEIIVREDADYDRPSS